MPKPIIFLGAKNLTRKQVEDIANCFSDYYVFAYPSDEYKMEVFYEKDMAEIEHKELKALIEKRFAEYEKTINRLMSKQEHE